LVPWRINAAATRQWCAFWGGSATKLPHHINNHLIVLPQSHHVLTSSKATIPFDSHKYVQIKIFRAMPFRFDFPWLVLILQHPPLANHVKQNQAVFMNVI
jgi:hypothetical protein